MPYDNRLKPSSVIANMHPKIRAADTWKGVTRPIQEVRMTSQLSGIFHVAASRNTTTSPIQSIVFQCA